MPTYNYKCESCGHEFEAFQNIFDEPLDKCPNCKQHTVQKLISPAPIIKKGSGWTKKFHN